VLNIVLNFLDNPWVAALPFLLMGTAGFAFDNMQAAMGLLSEMRHPHSRKREHANHVYALLSFGGAALLAGIGFGVSGNYQIAAWCFVGAWLFSTISGYMGCSIFSRKARVAWSTVISIVGALLLYWFYLWLCPVLKISPSGARFNALGESYSFRVENKSDHDTYMNSFIFLLDSSAYSTKDFDFQVAKDSLKPLDQQLDGVYYGVPDTFGETGFLPESKDTHFFLFYVYHLLPHESRQVSIKRRQYEASTDQKVEVSSEVLSFTDKAVPTTKDGIVVYVPALITRPLAITGFLICYFKDGTYIPCEMRPSQKGPMIIPKGCISLAVVSEVQPIPQKILAGKCEP